MLNWLINLINPVQNLGALDDNRPYEEQRKDYFFEETVGTPTPVVWKEKKPDEWRSFNLRSQDGSGSCVKQTIAKLAEVLYFLRTGEKIPFSAGFYKYRSNFPKSGMIGVDAFEIWQNRGIPLESSLPSQDLDDQEMNTLKDSSIIRDSAVAFKIGNYVQFIPQQDFETIASTIQVTGKAVMVWFRFGTGEWTDIPSVKVLFPQYHHSITAIDFTLYKGKKYLVIEDSWGKFNSWKGRRLISEEFFKARNTFGAYPINFKYLDGTDKEAKPKYRFETILKFGQSNNDIKALQDILKFEGLFPSNSSSTGYFGAITVKAVLDFQKKYQVAPDAELEELGGRTVGPKTLNKLNELYGG